MTAAAAVLTRLDRAVAGLRVSDGLGAGGPAGAVRRAVAGRGHPAPLVQAGASADRLLARLLPDRVEDDVVLVAVHLEPQDTPA